MRNIISKFLFTLLALSLGFSQVWAATSAVAGTYATAKPSSGGKALDMSGGSNTVFVYRPKTGGNSSFNTSDPIGIKTTGNANGVAFYISTSMKFYATLNQKKESKNKSCDVKVYQITESLLNTIASATSSQLSSDPSGLTTTELTDYKKTVSYSSNADADPINSAEVTLPAGYYYVLAVESDGNAMYWYSITLSTAAVTKHSVTYDLNGGTGDAPTQADVAEGSTFTVADMPVGVTPPTDKEFDKWNDGTNDYVAGATYTMGTSDVTLTAQWRDETVKYAVTYDLNGASGDAPTSPSKAAGDEFSLAAAPTWAGHVFDGWLCSADGLVKAAGASYTMTATATTFTAQWHDADCKIYSLTGGIGSAEVTADATKAQVTAEMLQLSSTNARIKLTPATGETFKSGDVITMSGTIGNTSKNFGAIVYATNGSTTIATATIAGTTNPLIATATLSADADYVFLKRVDGTTMTFTTFEVHRSCAEGTAAGLSYATASVEKITTDAAFTNPLTNTNSLVIAGYGSSDASVATVAANGQVTIVGTGSATITAYSAIQTKAGTLYAAGTASYTLTVATPPTYTVTYDANGGSGTMTDPNEYAAGAEVTLLANTFTAPDASHAWSAWVVTDAGDNVVPISEGKFTMPASNATVTAQWALISDFDVRFFQGYGANEQIGTTQSISTGNFAVPEADPTREGYRFLGWSTDGTEANIVDVAAYAITAATDFTAVWVQQFEVTFNLQGHGSAIAPQTIDDGGKVAKPADPYEVGQEFLGWFKESTCDNAWNFATDAVTEPTELFAKWVAFTGCVMLRPATSGSAPSAVGDEIVMQAGSTGATMTALANVDKLTYTTNGLQFGSTSGVKVNVVLANEMVVGTTISMKLVAAGDKTRGLFLYTSAGAKIDAFTCWVDGVNPASNGAEETFTYTVVAGDGLEGTNEFQLWRNNTVILNTLKVESCGSAIIYHDLTYAVDPAGKGTVTLGASSVREGLTTTAEYSAIDEAYDFDEWQISGAGASIADASANPAVITMGTEDAVVTLKLKAALPKHSVTFQMNGHGVAPDGQMIKEGAKVLKPEDPVADGWEFLGWYKESTFDNEWDFDVDVMGTTNIILYAKWLDETGVIKLMDGSTVNTTNFVSPGTATTVTINEVEHNCLTAFSSNRTSLAGTKPTDVVQYNATTNKAMMQVTFYNKHATSEKTVYVWKVEEGDESATPIEITLPAKSLTKTEYFEFNSSKNRSFYVTVADKSNTGIIQVKVFDNGETALKRAGQVGYSVNMNKGRMCAITNTATSFEGLTMTTSSDYAVLNNSNLSTKSYVSFSITSPVILSVTKSGGKFYVSQNPDEKGTIYSTNQELDLNATGTWYVGSETSGSAASFTKFEFKAPKCEKPVFNALDNSELCSGEPFEALDGTGTVSDGGTVTYEWFAEGESTVLATTATFTPSADGSYFVVATNSLEGFADNVATSDVVTVTHYAMVEITSAPKDVRDDVGADATLTVAASGKNLSYQWFTCDDVIGTGAVEIPGETNASLDVTVPDGTQYYRVEVASDCGTAYVVAKVEKWVDFTQVNVSENTSWNWVNAAAVNIKLDGDGTYSLAKNEEGLMANIRKGEISVTNDATFNSQALLFYGENVRATEGGVYYASVGHIKFTTTVDGFVTVRFADNGTNNRCVRISGGTEEEFSEPSANKTDFKEFKAFVPAGEVEIMGVNEDHTGENKYIRILYIAFEKVDYSRAVNSGRIGTICLPNGGVIKEASLYEVSYFDNTSKKIFFDEILTGELIAGRPYVFLPNEGAKYMGVEFLDAANAGAGSYHGLVGFIGADADAETSVPDDENCYIIQNNQYRQVLAGADARIKSYRAYLRLPDVPTSAPSLAPGRRRISMGMAGEQVATGVDNLNASETPMKMIIDGKMYILRGEKLYDATGRLVK